MAWDSALDQDQAAINVGANHFKVLRGDTLDAVMTGHFLVLEHAARILVHTSRTV